MTETRHRPPAITADAPVSGESGGRCDPVGTSVLPVLQDISGHVYQCPGEPQTISPAVHLSRLANFYSKCRNCPHADDPRALSVAVAAMTAPHDSDGSGDLFQREGLGGRYLSALGRPQAEALATGVAAAFWEQVPRRCRSGDEPQSATSSNPELVVGRDSGAAARDLLRGVVRGLRRMGCHVIDVGTVARPLLDLAVFHLRVDGGMYVTGSGAPAGSVDMQVIDRDGIPWSTPGRLDRVRELMSATVLRSTRSGGGLQTYDVLGPARAEYQRHTHAMQPVRIGAAIECPLQREQAARWSESGPVQFLPLELDLRRLTSESDGGAARRELRARCQSEEFDLVLHLARDGRQVTLFDERGRRIDPAVWLIRLVERQSDGGGVVAGADVSPLTRGRLKALGRDVYAAGVEREALVRRLVETRSVLAADGCGRIWFADHYPVCDGLVTAVRLGDSAGQSSQPISHWAA